MKNSLWAFHKLYLYVLPNTCIKIYVISQNMGMFQWTYLSLSLDNCETVWEANRNSL